MSTCHTVDGQISLFDYIPKSGRSCSNCCHKCMMWRSNRCPYGGCYDDYRAKANSFEKATGRHRTGWSSCERPGEQDHWCRGGTLYGAEVKKICPYYVEYHGQTVRHCLKQNVSVFQDGYIMCGLVNTIGCETCYKEFEEIEEQNG